MNFWDHKFENIYYPFRVFTSLCLSFLVGILTASFISISFSLSKVAFIYIISAFALIGSFNYLLKSKFLALISFCFLSFFAGIVYYSHYDFINTKPIPYGQNISMTGKISEPPVVDAGNQKITLLITKAEDQNLIGEKVIIKKVDFPEYHFGDILNISGTILEPQNFSDFDYKSYLKRWHIVGQINQPKNVEFVGESNSFADNVYGDLYDTSEYFEDSLNSVLPEPHASLASGILLGVKRNIPDDLMSDLQKTGLTHIIALSGFNVTIIVIVLSSLLMPYLGRRYTFAVGIIFVLAFVLMTGAAASVIRAAIFSFLILYGTTIGRRADQTNLVLLTALIMVLANPYILRFDVGFQLSFLAFAGLIYIGPVISKFLDRGKFKALPSSIRLILAETLGAQIAVSPLILVQFGLVSIISPLANLLVVWIVPWVMLLTFACGLCAMIYTPLGQAAAIILWPSLEYIIKMVHCLANLPYSSIKF